MKKIIIGVYILGTTAIGCGQFSSKSNSINNSIKNFNANYSFEYLSKIANGGVLELQSMEGESINYQLPSPDDSKSKLIFSTESVLPEGISLNSDGILSGVILLGAEGSFSIKVDVNEKRKNGSAHTYYVNWVIEKYETPIPEPNPEPTPEPTPDANPDAKDDTLLWHADADSNGMDAWKGQQEAFEDRLSIQNDPEGLYGKVYQAMLLDGDLYKDKARCELYNSVLPDDSNLRYYEGDHLYFGWRSRVNSGIYASPDRSNSGNITQFKGDSSCGGPALGFTFKYGHLTLRSELYGVLWTGPLVNDFAGAWHDIVVRINFSKDSSKGFVELWYDGVQQKFDNNADRYFVATMCPNDEYVYLKQGVYRSTEITGTAYHWIESPKIGLSYGSVAPTP